jgi:hypothetical protein
VRYPVCDPSDRSQRLIGSISALATAELTSGGPCVIYLHCNASSQCEGQFLIANLCLRGIALFCFDFAGCGRSGAAHVSLGYFELIDVQFLIDSLALGQSMAAATALLVQHPLVGGKIVDSAFTSISEMIAAVARRLGVPAF